MHFSYPICYYIHSRVRNINWLLNRNKCAVVFDALLFFEPLIIAFVVLKHLMIHREPLITDIAIIQNVIIEAHPTRLFFNVLIEQSHLRLTFTALIILSIRLNLA